MKEGDRQLGKPARLYRDTKANVEALGLVAADEGCMAYATDTDAPGTFNGTIWTWTAPPPVAAGYALVSDGVDTWVADQTPAWTGEHSFAAGIAFTGASGANEITVPDNTAIALEILDAGGLEYVRAVSTDANPYLLIDPAGAGIKVGVGISTPDGTAHIHSATAGAVAAHAGADDLVIENSDHSGISILSPDAKRGQIYFGTPADSFGAMVRWDRSSLTMLIGTATAGGILSLRSANVVEGAVLDANQHFGIGVAAPLGQCHIDQASTTAAIPVLVLDQADVSEGFVNFIGSDRGVILSDSDSLRSVRVEWNGTVYRLALHVDA